MIEPTTQATIFYVVFAATLIGRPFGARFSAVTLLIALLQGYEARGLWHYGTDRVATPGFIFVGS